MKNALFAMAVVLVSNSAFAADANIAKVAKIAAAYISGSDTKVVVTKQDQGFCGGDGPSYIAVASVRTKVKYADSKGELALKTKWVPIRTYGILATELSEGSKALMASDQCLE